MLYYFRDFNVSTTVHIALFATIDLNTHGPNPEYNLPFFSASFNFISPDICLVFNVSNGYNIDHNDNPDIPPDIGADNFNSSLQ